MATVKVVNKNHTEWETLLDPSEAPLLRQLGTQTSSGKRQRGCPYIALHGQYIDQDPWDDLVFYYFGILCRITEAISSSSILSCLACTLFVATLSSCNITLTACTALACVSCALLVEFTPVGVFHEILLQKAHDLCGIDTQLTKTPAGDVPPVSAQTLNANPTNLERDLSTASNSEHQPDDVLNLFF